MWVKGILGLLVAVAVITGVAWLTNTPASKDNAVLSASVTSSTPDVDQHKPLEECAKERIAELDKMPVVATPDQYPVSEIYTGAVAKLDLSSSPVATRFKGMIENDMKEGVNFAGHYIIATWGMTGIGLLTVVVDATNGKAYPFPYVSQTGFSFSKNSALFVIDPMEKLKEAAPNCLYMEATARPYYFVWKDNTFTLIGPTDNPPPNSVDGGSMHQ